MRARDVRALAFAVITTLLVFGVAYALTRGYVTSLALAAAWAAIVMTRPRMRRVVRRLRGDTDWSGYFRND